jgi:hypothetical protein
MKIGAVKSRLLVGGISEILPVSVFHPVWKKILVQEVFMKVY